MLKKRLKTIPSLFNTPSPKYDLGDKVQMRNLKGQLESCVVIGFNGHLDGECVYAISLGGVVLENIKESEISNSN